MWRILDQGREPLRENLANLAGCDKEEIAISRNSSEALNTIIYGLEDIPKVQIKTSLQSKYSCAICGLGIEGLTPADPGSALFNNYKIHTVGIVCENISCVRVTPHVYTRLHDLDRLVKAVGEIAKK